jgi:hypothetical protein
MSGRKLVIVMGQEVVASRGMVKFFIFETTQQQFLLKPNQLLGPQLHAVDS